jgi:hypothetical protein
MSYVAALESAKLVSNDMIFDESGVLVAFGPELLHTFNKRFSALPLHMSGVDLPTPRCVL